MTLPVDEDVVCTLTHDVSISVSDVIEESEVCVTF